MNKVLKVMKNGVHELEGAAIVATRLFVQMPVVITSAAASMTESITTGLINKWSDSYVKRDKKMKKREESEEKLNEFYEKQEEES